MTFHPSPSAARRLLRLALIPALVAVSSRAIAGPADESILHAPLELDPAYGFDPRLELDPSLDPPEPPRARRTSRPPASPLRAPVTLSVGATYEEMLPAEHVIGVMMVLSVPLERFGAPRLGSPSIGDDTRLPRSSAPRDAGRPPAPPPPPPSPAAPPVVVVPAVPPPPLRIPVVVTPDVAHAAVEAALRHAKLVDPGARMDALAARARQSAGLPELRLRVLRTVDSGEGLSPTLYDPTRITGVDDVKYWLEARATWRLDRLLFAEEEVTLERIRQERADAQEQLRTHVIKVLFAWQRSLALAENAALPPEEILGARLAAIEAEAELDLLTGGWFAKWVAGRSLPGPGSSTGAAVPAESRPPDAP
jgi:hypothetical protein